MRPTRFSRVAGACGIAALVTFTAGWVLGDLVQPAAFSPARHDISYLGALTANHPWLYNQLGANLSGALVVVLGLGLWQALGASRLGRLGAGALAAAGLGMFLDGLFRLDCRPIDVGCSNDSWHSHAHKIESGFTAAFTLVSIVLLALAFRRVQGWRRWWIPTLAAIPAVLIANIAFSPLGAGAATRAGTVVLLGTIAFFGMLLRRA
jgi:hypothetical protein